MTTDTNQPAPAALNAERQAQRQALTDGVRGEYRHELNIPYGGHPKQILDIYHPKQATAAPILVFLHGGGFRNGAPGPQGYVGAGLLRHGGMFVAMGYRLIPDAAYPDSCDDVEIGLRWLHDHIGEHGGDPTKIYLSGTSAGASLAAAVTLRSWVADPGLPADLIKGLVLFSGRYDRTDADRETDSHATKRYVQDLTSAIERTPPHTIVVNTDDESAFPDVPDNAIRITGAIRAHGGSVEHLLQPQADHFSSSRSLAEGEGGVFAAIQKMMRLS